MQDDTWQEMRTISDEIESRSFIPAVVRRLLARDWRTLAQMDDTLKAAGDPASVHPRIRRDIDDLLNIRNELNFRPRAGMDNYAIHELVLAIIAIVVVTTPSRERHWATAQWHLKRCHMWTAHQ